MLVILNGHSFHIDRDDWARLRHKPWRAVRNSFGRLLVTRQISNAGQIKNIYIQHEIIGDVPDGMIVDHINGNPADHRRSNLRVCTYRENAFNRRPRSITGFKGVSRSGDKFLARIKDGARNRRIGLFATAEDAAAAYDAAARAAFGEFAWLNSVHRHLNTKDEAQHHATR